MSGRRAEAGAGWNPDQYLLFGDARLRPALDLVDAAARLLGNGDAADALAIADLGCGPGNVTPFLAARWPKAAITGVDTSDTMLARARAVWPATGGARADWVQADIADFAVRHPARFDLVYSNAALHWLDSHDTLFPALARMLAPGGALAVQLPNNFTAPSHTAIAETIADGPWRQQLTPLFRPSPIAAQEAYLDWLEGAGLVADIWQTSYLHVLSGADPVLAWTRGSVLKPLLDALDADGRDAFTAAYAARLREAYPARADGRVLFPFQRLFVVARHP